MPVNTPSEDYIDMQDSWALVRKVISDDCREWINPIMNPEAFKPYSYHNEFNQVVNCGNEATYSRMLRQCAIYAQEGDLWPATERTRDGLVGLMKRKPAKIELPPALEYMIEDVTGTGIGIEELTEETLGEIETVGGQGILVDYPQTDTTNMSKADLKLLKILPRFYPYTVENILSVGCQLQDGLEVLTRVVLREFVAKKDTDDEFNTELEVQYRVLRLEKTGNSWVYTQQEYDSELKARDKITVLNGQGKPMDKIAFFFINAKKNGAHIEKPPLYSLAKLNLSHLRASCAHKHYLKIAGSGTLFFTTSHDTVSFNEANPDGIYLGPDIGYNLGSQGQAWLLQATDTNAHTQAMEILERQMQKVGADIIEPQSGNVTATEIANDQAAKVSPLHRTVSNIEMGYRWLIDVAAEFMKDVDTSKVVLDLNKDFIPAGKDAQLLLAELTGITDKVTSIATVRDNWRTKYDLIPEDKTDEELNKEIAEEEHQFNPLPDINALNGANQDNLQQPVQPNTVQDNLPPVKPVK